METKLVHYTWFGTFANVAIGAVQSGKQPFAKLCGDDKASLTFCKREQGCIKIRRGNSYSVVSETVNVFNRCHTINVNNKRGDIRKYQL
jgi:hypothetical protein